MNDDEITADCERRGWEIQVTPVDAYGVSRAVLILNGFVLADEAHGATESLARARVYQQQIDRENREAREREERESAAADIERRGWSWHTAGMFTMVVTPHGIGSSIDPMEAYRFALNLEAKHLS